MSTRILYTGTRAPEPTPEGIALFHAPMLTVEVLSLDPALFMDPANLGVVLYSRHAITALERSDIDLDGATIFCVGEKTGARASRAFPGGNVLVAPEDKQRFEGLAAWMRGISVLPPVILSLGLRGKPRPLAAALEGREGGEVIEVAAYATCETTDLAALPPFEPGQGAPPFDWIVLVSPKGARAWRALVGRLEATEERRWLQVPRAVIGPTTAKACQEMELPYAMMPARPDVALLLQQLARHDGRRG